METVWHFLLFIHGSRLSSKTRESQGLVTGSQTHLTVTEVAQNAARDPLGCDAQAQWPCGVVGARGYVWVWLPLAEQRLGTWLGDSAGTLLHLQASSATCSLGRWPAGLPAHGCRWSVGDRTAHAVGVHRALCGDTQLKL